MLRNVCLLSLLMLAGCAGQWEAPWNQAVARTEHFDFDWRLSGDPVVAPLQVFSSGREVWLQFAPGQELPAIFARSSRGDVPVAYRRQDPYVIVDGGWQALTLRGGRYEARAEHAVHMAQASEPPEPDRTRPTQAAFTPAEHVRLSEAPALEKTDAPVAAKQAAASFHAGSPDSTLRAVLARWAQAQGWVFEPQHWAVDVDIPLAGSADFTGDFRQAVRDLLASSELSDRPVQPCFYSNHVLRVVPFTQACDPSAVPTGSAAS